MRAAGVGVLALLGLAGCATRADLVQQDREIRRFMREQQQQVQAVQREVERLRANVEEAGSRNPKATNRQIVLLEQRVSQLEVATGIGPESKGEEIPPGEIPAAGEIALDEPPAVVEPPPAVTESAWRQDIAREQTSAGTVNVAERGEYLAILDGLARQDCAMSVPQLNSFAATHPQSPLADNALYWAARCHAQSRDQNQAISKFYEVVTRYPKGDKAAAALWAQGNLFVDIGNTPDARIVFSKLIRDYPSSSEAGLARQKLTELER